MSNSDEDFQEVTTRRQRRQARDDLESSMLDDNRLQVLERKMDSVIKSFDINVAVTGNLDRRRHLLNQDLIREIATELSPMKLQLSTLLEVFMAAMPKITSADLDQNGKYFSRAIYFAYDQHIWRGNVSFEFSPYVDLGMVKFTNIRLPNDGYLYTQRYLKEPGSKSYTPVESDELTDILAAYVEALGLGEFAAEIVPMYRLSDGRFQVKIWNAEKSSCYSINYEYGSFESNVVQPAYNMQLIRDRLAARKVGK